jgi:glycerophosphoryl diester phosphodiesterase
MLVIGHRGAAALAPENTLASIRAAFEAGADMAEIDVRLSAEGRPVVVHDETLERLFDRRSRVDELTQQQLANYGIPTLEQAWEAARGRLVIEIKGRWGSDEGTAVAGAVATTLGGRGTGRAIVSSFDLPALRAFANAMPDVCTGVLTPDPIDAASNIACAADGHHEICFLPAARMSAHVVDAAHAAGRRVVAWTVNDRALIRAMRAWGADGVITDDPRLASLQEP